MSLTVGSRSTRLSGVGQSSAPMVMGMMRSRMSDRRMKSLCWRPRRNTALGGGVADAAHEREAARLDGRQCERHEVGVLDLLLALGPGRDVEVAHAGGPATIRLHLEGKGLGDEAGTPLEGLAQERDRRPA